MVKKSAVILAILAMLALSAGLCSAYTVSMWPAPGVPNTVFKGDSPCLPGVAGMSYLKGPVVPACSPPLIPGVIHAALSCPFRAMAIVATPCLTGKLPPRANCCPQERGEAAYVTAAVPCTPVRKYSAPAGW